MSIESLLLSAWEEEGFVGKTRIPLAMSDVDVLAIHAAEGKVRVGESKVREGSQTIYLVDDSSLAWIESQPHPDFAAWMGEDWSRWLGNLPKLWDLIGRPAVPWLLPASQVKELQVIFCCNLVVFCDRGQADEALQRSVVRHLRENPALAGWGNKPDFVKAKVTPTVEVVTDLTRNVFDRVESGYGRRFANHFKDMFREVHRYLQPELNRLPYDREGQKLGTRKTPYKERVRKETVLGLLKAMGVGEDELRRWLVEV
ncbi:MAG TPA: hypothetical protein VJ739_06200 [Gemmataceae bacterium]|nr:hypothetical protein [Gemmataceae bacterium]